MKIINGAGNLIFSNIERGFSKHNLVGSGQW